MSKRSTSKDVIKKEGKGTIRSKVAKTRRKRSGRSKTNRSKNNNSEEFGTCREMHQASVIQKPIEQLQSPIVPTPTPTQVSSAELVPPVESTPSRIQNLNPSTRTKTSGPAIVVEAEAKKWVGEDVAVNFVKTFDIKTVRSHRADLFQLAVNYTVGQCETFYANEKRNRNINYPMYDFNRVQLEKSPTNDTGYINASHVKFDNFPRKVIMAQYPITSVPGTVEDLWRMVLQENVTSLHLVMEASESDQQFAELFPRSPGSYEYFGSIFINNKKTEQTRNANIYTLEILPDGCSNSTICILVQHLKWKTAVGSAFILGTMKRALAVTADNDAANDGTLCVVSTLGAGRAGTFVLTCVALHLMNKGIQFSVLDLAMNLRKQRPGATETYFQYTFIYTILMSYIQKKLARNQLVAEKTPIHIETLKNEENASEHESNPPQ